MGRAGSSAGGAREDRDEASARPGRERDVEPHGDPRGDPHRAQRRDRRRHHDLASRLRPLRRRRSSVPLVLPGLRRARRAVANPHRRADTTVTKAKQGRTSGWAASSPLRGRDLDGPDVIADELQELTARRRPYDRERLDLGRLRRPRVPPGRALPDHAYGELFGQRDPRLFLQALADLAHVARFVGDSGGGSQGGSARARRPAGAIPTRRGPSRLGCSATPRRCCSSFPRRGAAAEAS